MRMYEKPDIMVMNLQFGEHIAVCGLTKPFEVDVPETGGECSTSTVSYTEYSIGSCDVQSLAS